MVPLRVAAAVLATLHDSGGPSRPPTAPPRQTGGPRTAHEVLWPRPTPHWPPTSPSLARRRVAAQCRSDGAADDKWLVSSVGQGRRLEERLEMRHAVLSAEGGMQPRRPVAFQHMSCKLVAADDRGLFDHAGPTKSMEM